MSWFYQQGPKLTNPFTSDSILRDLLQKLLPADILNKVEDDFTRFGQRVVDEIEQLGERAEREEPQLINFDVWGHRVDKLVVSTAWDKLKDISAEEGLVAIGYEREYNEYSRIVQFVKLYLFTPSSAIYTCPLAMTDGAARLLELYGTEQLRKEYLGRYIDRNPSNFYVSGQWMTERTGGSDLANAETIARMVDGEWRLYGPKWFTSAITGDTAMTLARIENENGVIEGSRGLSVFILDIFKNGEPNCLRLDRLKDKLGTRALPTAEIELEGVPAKLVGEVNKGIKTIATMLNITRLYNGVSAVSYAQRAVQLASDYAKKREAFGKRLIDLPLHKEVLENAQNIVTGCLYLTFFSVSLMGKEECGVATEQESLLFRLLIPVTKLYTSKMCLGVVSEMVEAMGGAGYLEDSGFPRLLRDSQVFSIWEGTTNVLSLDVIRAISKNNALKAWSKYISQSGNSKIKNNLTLLLTEVEKYPDPSVIARRLSYSIGRITIAYLLDHFIGDTNIVDFWLSIGSRDYL